MRKKALERMKKKQKASVLTGTKAETTSVKKKLMFNTYLVITHMCYYEVCVPMFNTYLDIINLRTIEFTLGIVTTKCDFIVLLQEILLTIDKFN